MNFFLKLLTIVLIIAISFFIITPYIFNHINPWLSIIYVILNIYLISLITKKIQK
jgi:hypothetical protein